MWLVVPGVGLQRVGGEAIMDQHFGAEAPDQMAAFSDPTT